MQFSHFTSEPLRVIRSITQKPRYEYGSPHDKKPRGLWLSVDGDDDWESFCSANMPQWVEGKLRYRVHVDMSRVLVLKSYDEILGFNSQYGRDVCCYGFAQVAIDWARVAERHSGIIIAPYCYGLHLDLRTSWYYGWSCASGCIWDASAIINVEEIKFSKQELSDEHSKTAGTAADA